MYLLFGISLHASLDPTARPGRLFVELGLAELVEIKGGMRRGNIAASLEAGTLEEVVQPLFEAGELFNLDASPFLSMLASCSRI